MSDWRPIETAPKDGTTILVYEPGWADPWHSVLAARWVYASEGGRFEGRGWKTFPTYWMPLPAPPDDVT